MIYCIGDSHINMFSGTDMLQQAEILSGKIDGIRSYWISGVLAYNLNRLGSQSQGREKSFALLNTLPKGSNVLFGFGEIDCRLHILKNAELSKTSINKVAYDVINNYFSFLYDVMNLGFNVIVNCIHPNLLDPKYDIPRCEFQYYGDFKQINECIKLFNRYLATECFLRRFHFINYFDKIYNNGNIDTSYFKDAIHLGQKIMPFVISEFKRIGVL